MIDLDALATRMAATILAYLDEGRTPTERTIQEATRLAIYVHLSNLVRADEKSP